MKCKVLRLISDSEYFTSKDPRPHRIVICSMVQVVLLQTPYGVVKRELFGRDVKVGDYINHTVIDPVDRLTNRLKRLGIEVSFKGNLPWVYLDTVNNIKVTEKFHAKHGYTAFMKGMKIGNEGYKFVDRRNLFAKIREMIKESKYEKQLHG